MLSRPFQLLLLGIVSLASYAQADPSTTTTTTAGTTTTTSTSVYTSTTQLQLDDVLTTQTLTANAEAATPHVPGTTTLQALTSTVTAPAPTATTISHACTNFHLSFGKACCPKKSHCHKKKKPKKHPKKKNPRALDSASSVQEMFKRQQYAVDLDSGKQYYRCGSQIYEDDSLSTGNPGDSITIFTDRDFPDPSYILFADIQAANVCGDIYIDGVFAGSTTCPELGPNPPPENGAGNAQDAIASGAYGYGFFYVPAGKHTLTFTERYEGGAASFAIFPACEIAVVTEPAFTETEISSSASPTVTLSLDPTLTITDLETITVTTTPLAVTDLSTETPSPITEIFTPQAIPTTVFQCNSIKVNIQCPRLTSASKMNKWMVNELNFYNGKAGSEADVGVTCGSYDWTEYYYY